MGEHTIDLATFKKAGTRMIATNDNAYRQSSWSSRRLELSHMREYTEVEIARIIESGSLVEQQTLSRHFFNKDGYYKHIIIHYATLLQCSGILIPNPVSGQSLQKAHIQKRYYSAIDYVEKMQLSTFFTNCALRALVDGIYYGAILKVDAKHLTIIDLPYEYCRSRFRDESGNDLVEFNVSYFDTILDDAARKTALAAYPEIVSKAYKAYHKAKKGLPYQWVVLPASIGICFPFFDGHPLFLSVIPKTLEYDDAVNTARERDAEEIRKILVQKIPHLPDGRLVFEPDEAEEMHAAAVGMLKNNENIHVLTTYADVDAIVSKTTSDNDDDVLQQIKQNIYSEAGVTSEVFATKSSAAIDQSLNNDLALMMYLANKFARFITNTVNDLFGNSNITFKYTILPVSYYNASKFIDSAYKLTNSGYSYVVPAVAMGISQRDLVNLKDLENDILGLRDKMLPPRTSYTSSDDDEGGRPEKEGTEKAEVTVVTEESRSNAEGGS